MSSIIGKKYRQLNILLIMAIITLILSECTSRFESQPEISVANISFRDFPGVTEEEIQAIDALKHEYPYFSYGVNKSTEAFIDENGEMKGFSVLFSNWLSTFFEIPFKPVFIESPNLFETTQQGDVDFSGPVIYTEDRQLNYHTTTPIGMHSLKLIRRADSPPISAISQTALPRYGFLTNSVSIHEVAAATEEGSYTAVFIDSFDQVYPLLERNEIDAFILLNIIEEYFDEYDDLITEDFFPIIYRPVSMSTGKPELEPIISILQKVLENDGFQYFNELAKKGYEDYRRHKLYMRLTDEERDYLRNTTVVPLTVGGEFLPVNYYNIYKKQWEGSAFDILGEVEKLTGLSFEIVNDPQFTSNMAHIKLLDGSALITTIMVYTEDRKDDFLWSKYPYMTDKLVLISKQDFPPISISDLPYLKLGYENIGYTTRFRNRYPQIENTREYTNAFEMMYGLSRGEVDMVIATWVFLYSLNKYYEIVGYKANFIDNLEYDISFAFNKDQPILCSIVDKSLSLIEMKKYIDYWEAMTYDQQALLLRTQRPWLIRAIVLSIIILLLLTILFIRSRTAGKRLEKLVKQRTGELENQSTLLQTIIDSIPNIVYCKDLNLNYTLTNTYAEEYFGIEKSKIIGKHNEGNLQFPPEIISLINEKEQTVIKNNEWVLYETWIQSSTGTNRLFEVVSAPLEIGGTIIGLTGIAHDITERKAMEEEALTASLYKSTFLANMSHEIRTPMNSIMGFAELATDSDSMPQIKDYLGKITDSTDWLLRIINDILDISKIEAGKMDFEEVPFDLSEIFSRCQSVILPSITEKDLTLNVYTEPIIGKKLVSDPIRIYQVLINLLSNAVKFTHSGSVKFTSLVKNIEDNKATVYFEVKDTGIGMSQEQMAKIFDPFMQGESSTTRNYGGSGLGLTITKNIVELMGGQLSVESTLNVGSTFSFELIFNTIDAPEEKIEQEKPAKLEKPNFDGLVLVCDDNPLNQELICAHLERLGLMTMAAENGKIAVDIVLERKTSHKRPFDLILMDMFMPVMDGMEAATKILDMGTGTPIIAMTANIMASEIEKYQAIGMPDCLGKPFTSQELWRLLLNYLVPLSSSPIDEFEDNQELQRKLLINFFKNNQTVHNEIAAAVAAGDTKLAHRLAHSLKGNAGLIGKMELRNAAAEVEALLKDGTASIWETKMNALKTELLLVLEELKPLIEEADEQERMQDAMMPEQEGALALLDRLEQMLEAINPECITLLNDIRAIPESEDLVRQIEEYNFEAALQALRVLKERMHGNL